MHLEIVPEVRAILGSEFDLEKIQEESSNAQRVFGRGTKKSAKKSLVSVCIEQMKRSNEWAPSEEDKLAAETLFAKSNDPEDKDPYVIEAKKRYDYTYTCAKFFIFKHLNNVLWSDFGVPQLKTFAMVFEVYLRRVEELGIAKKVIQLDVCNKFRGTRSILSTCINNSKPRAQKPKNNEGSDNLGQSDTSNSVSFVEILRTCINEYCIIIFRTCPLFCLAFRTS